MLHTLIIFFVLFFGVLVGFIVGFVLGYEHCAKRHGWDCSDDNSDDS